MNGQEEEVKISYIPEIPKQLLIWGLNNINPAIDNMQEAFKRRLVRIATNFAVPVDLLERIDGLGLYADEFDRVGLPLSSWESYKEFVMTSESIKESLYYAKYDMGSSELEATLRSRVWDPLLRSMISTLDCFKSEFDVKPLLGTKTNCKVDLAAVTQSLQIPILIVEISKDKPVKGVFHKDFAKMITTMSQVCLELADELDCRDEDPGTARIFGLWVGHTEFRFCVAALQLRWNESMRITERSVNVSFHPHWISDLVGITEGDKDCAVSCCEGLNSIKADLTDRRVMAIEPQILCNRAVSVRKDEEDVEDQAISKPTTPTPKSTVTRRVDYVDVRSSSNSFFNVKAVCKLKAVVECAVADIVRLNIILARPRKEKDDTVSPYYQVNRDINQSPASSSQSTPMKGRVQAAPLKPTVESVPSRPLNQAMECEGIAIEKPSSREIDVYRNIPDWHKMYFATLRGFEEKSDEDGNKRHVLHLERLEPALIGRGIHSPHIRKDTFREFVLEAGTFAVHVLFDLLILHEKVGFVHSDISPNNVMFSRKFQIWKLIDFNLSCLIEESLSRPRTAGTDGFKAPESFDRRMFSTASDVFTVGTVIGYMFLSVFDTFEKKNDKDRYLAFEFEGFVKRLLEFNPDRRITVRGALKVFVDFVSDNVDSVPGFEVYGKDSVFPAVNYELAHPPELGEITLSKITINES